MASSREAKLLKLGATYNNYKDFEIDFNHSTFSPFYKWHTFNSKLIGSSKGGQKKIPSMLKWTNLRRHCYYGPRKGEPRIIPDKCPAVVEVSSGVKNPKLRVTQLILQHQNHPPESDESPQNSDASEDFLSFNKEGEYHQAPPPQDDKSSRDTSTSDSEESDRSSPSDGPSSSASSKQNFYKMGPAGSTPFSSKKREKIKNEAKKEDFSPESSPKRFSSAKPGPMSFKRRMHKRNILSSMSIQSSNGAGKVTPKKRRIIFAEEQKPSTSTKSPPKMGYKENLDPLITNEAEKEYSSSESSPERFSSPAKPGPKSFKRHQRNILFPKSVHNTDGEENRRIPSAKDKKVCCSTKSPPQTVDMENLEHPISAEVISGSNENPVEDGKEHVDEEGLKFKEINPPSAVSSSLVTEPTTFPTSLELRRSERRKYNSIRLEKHISMLDHHMLKQHGSKCFHELDETVKRNLLLCLLVGAKLWSELSESNCRIGMEHWRSDNYVPALFLEASGDISLSYVHLKLGVIYHLDKKLQELRKSKVFNCLVCGRQELRDTDVWKTCGRCFEKVHDKCVKESGNSKNVWFCAACR